jgi:polyisoprenoid-binding protein YceI
MKSYLSLALLCLGSIYAETPQWRVQSDRSEISFYVPAKITNVRGYFRRFSLNQFSYDEKVGLTSLKGVLTIETASVFTRDRKRDAHLRADDFFYTDKYAVATAEVTSVKLMTGDFYEAAITLQIRDKKQTYAVPVKIQKDETGSLRISGTLVIDRSYFDLTGNHVANIIMQDKVDVSVRLILTR